MLPFRATTLCGLTGAILLSLLAACATPLPPADPVQRDSGLIRPNPPAPCCVYPDRVRLEHEDPNSPLAQRSVFFDFDQFIVPSEYVPLVELHAKYLARNQNLQVVIGGHADARGSREYNLALGQKRAQAVQKVFLLYGVAERNIEVISFGEEQPMVEGDNEAAWAKNRRADIIYPPSSR